MNWMRWNSTPSSVRERLHRQRLGQPGHALDEQVAPGHERDDHPFEQRILADDDPLHVVEHVFERRLRPMRLRCSDGIAHLAGAPRPLAPAVAIGTAKPMPAKLSDPEGLASPSTIPIT